MPKYKKGDVVFTGGARWSSLAATCPVCAGSGWVFVKPFGSEDAAGHKYRCEYCKQSAFGPGKVVDIWLLVPRVDVIKIEGVETLSKPGEEEVRYLFNVTGNSWNSVNETDVWASQAEAQAVAEKKTAEANADADTRRVGATVHPHEHAAWNVGYCKAQLKDLESRFEFFEKQLDVLSKKRKPKANAAK